jgi:bifunctional DNA-binding transcriptional regulator/antitoxin component of YhaV-PrlF toxin-antitoxin module
MARKTQRELAERRVRYRAARPARDRRDRTTEGRRKLPQPETLADGTTRYFLVLGPKGRVLLPAEMRAAMNLELGDVITAWLKDGEVRMHSHVHGLRRIQAEASSVAKGTVYASDELIAERRAEAAKEDEQALRWLRERKRKR